MIEGWIQVDRSIADSVVNSDAGLMHLWINLKLRANWRPSYFRKRLIGVGQVAFSVGNLADDLGITPSTLRRRLQELESDGRIKVENAANRFSVVTLLGQDTCEDHGEHDRRTVNQTAELTDDPPPDATGGLTDDTTANTTGDATGGEPVDKPTTNQRRTDDALPKKETISTRKEINKTSSPLPPAAAATPWKEGVEEVLRELGVMTAGAVTKAACLNGLTIGEAQGIIGHWQKNPGAWSLSYLAWRISNHVAGAVIEEGWPKPGEDYEDFQREQQRAQEDARREQKRADQLAEEKLRSAAEAKHDAYVDRLEHEHGDYLDCLDKEELRALLKSALGNNGNAFLIESWNRKGCPVPLPANWTGRQIVLEHLASEKVGAH